MPIIVIYYAIKRTANKARKENMSKIDFQKQKEYFREILKEYSLAELSYIDDFKVVPRREITATLLNLKLKKKIEINKDSIIVIDNNLENLKKTEEFILKNIHNGKVKIGDSGYIESYAQDEAIEDELITIKTKEEGEKRVNKNIKKKKIIWIILFVIFAILCNNVEKINVIDNNIIKGLCTVLVIGFFIVIAWNFILTPITSLVYFLLQTNSYKRTEKGEELNEKIEGLKQYIIDYSLLIDKEQNDLMLWDEYLIYSIIFDINSTEIVEEISKLIEIEFETGKIYFSKAE